jgi:hypothetical protein
MLPDIEKRIEAFVSLGEELFVISMALKQKDASILKKISSLRLYEAANESPQQNPWFSPQSVNQAIESLGKMLERKNLDKWCRSYPEVSNTHRIPKKIAVIMAGNIPLVGFHDFLCVLISGHKILVKLSSQDKLLPEIVADLLIETEPGFKNAIELTENIISGFDAIIATGSNNSSRYFDYYFGKYPSIIRRNRNSIGILDNNTSTEELENLGKDIFSYYGLGCRNVSMLLLPEGYDLRNLPGAWEKHADVLDNHKYANNYDYQKAVLAINNIDHLDTGFCLLRQENSLSSPVSVIHWQTYSSNSHLEEFIRQNSHNIQCITTSENALKQIAGSVAFGKSQQPELWDYADGIDTIKFLLTV